LPAVAQAAIAHAQFETIHPFVDGNGRTGRALIYMVLRRRDLAKRTTPPVSLALATRAKDYVAGLAATRYVGKKPGQQNRVFEGRDLIDAFTALERQLASPDGNTAGRHA
jgi:Fic family protein